MAKTSSSGKYWLVTLNNGARMRVKAKNAEAASAQFKDSRDKSVRTIRDPDDLERQKRRNKRK